MVPKANDLIIFVPDAVDTIEYQINEALNHTTNQIIHSLRAQAPLLSDTQLVKLAKVRAFLHDDLNDAIGSLLKLYANFRPLPPGIHWCNDESQNQDQPTHDGKEGFRPQIPQIPQIPQTANPTPNQPQVSFVFCLLCIVLTYVLFTVQIYRDLHIRLTYQTYVSNLHITITRSTTTRNCCLNQAKAILQFPRVFNRLLDTYQLHTYHLLFLLHSATATTR
jgi:hypothetical protein